MPTDLYYSVKDATDQQSNGTTSPGTLTFVSDSTIQTASYVVTYKYTSYVSYRALLYYNITLPSSAIISSVTGQIVNTASNDSRQHGVQRITSDWSEAQGTNAPSFDATILATWTPAVSTWNYFSSAALTALVQGWVNGTIPNYGLRLIVNPDNYGLGAIASNQWTARETGSNIPNLSITYTVNQVPTAPTNLQTGAQDATGVPITWQHNDPNGDAQSQFQYRFRLAD